MILGEIENWCQMFIREVSTKRQYPISVCVCLCVGVRV